MPNLAELRNIGSAISFGSILEPVVKFAAASVFKHILSPTTKDSTKAMMEKQMLHFDVDCLNIFGLCTNRSSFYLTDIYF